MRRLDAGRPKFGNPPRLSGFHFVADLVPKADCLSVAATDATADRVHGFPFG
jgi:hypothetical protein